MNLSSRQFARRLTSRFWNVFSCSGQREFLKVDLQNSQQFEEFSTKIGVSWPCWGSHKILINESLVDGNLGIRSASQHDLRTTRRIRRTRPAFHDARRRENLHSVTNGGDRLIRFVEHTHDFEDTHVKSQIFWCPSTRNQQPVVVGFFDRGEVCVQRKIMARLFAVCLIAFEIVNRRADPVPRFFIRTNN